MEKWGIVLGDWRKFLSALTVATLKILWSLAVSSGFMKLSGNEGLVPQMCPCQHSVWHLTSEFPTELPEDNLLYCHHGNILWRITSQQPDTRAAAGTATNRAKDTKFPLKKLRDLYSFLGSAGRCPSWSVFDVWQKNRKSQKCLEGEEDGSTASYKLHPSMPCSASGNSLIPTL